MKHVLKRLYFSQEDEAKQHEREQAEKIKKCKQLAQIQAAIKNKMIIYKYETDWIFRKIDNINEKVVTTDYLESQHEEWIGNTVLHFAADEEILETFDILLNHGADFTIRNRHNCTALHQIIKRHIADISKAYTLNNPFVNAVLSAHLKYRNFRNPSNDNGLSHFHIACAANNIETVRGFIQHRVFLDNVVGIRCPYFSGFTALHFATKYSAFEVVTLLVNYGANLHCKDATGMTPLHVALERKLQIINDPDAVKPLKEANDAILRFLLDKTNNGMLITDNWGFSSFHYSCTLLDSKLAMRFLLRMHANKNQTVNMDSPLCAGFTPLHFAIHCNTFILAKLLAAEADLSIKNAKQVSPLDMLIDRFPIDYVQTAMTWHPVWSKLKLSDNTTELLYFILAMRNGDRFIEYFSIRDINIKIPSQSPLWPTYTPMHLAVQLSKKDMTTHARSAQASLNIVRHLHEKKPTMIFEQDAHGYTPLHLAFRLNKNPLIDLLLELLTACPRLDDLVDEDELSFLHIACATNKGDLVFRLLLVGGNINRVYKGASQSSRVSGSTPLHFAVANESTEAVDALMKGGPNIYIKDANDMTPIHLLMGKATSKIADILLSLPSLRDSVVTGIGLSHLHVASSSWLGGSLDAIKRLLDNGADINAQITCQQNLNTDSDILADVLKQHAGNTPLIIAYDQRNYPSAILLLKRGADIFVKHKKGVALLHTIFEHNIGDAFAGDFLRAIKGSETVLALVKAETGMTSLHLACIEVDTDLIEQLLSDATEGAHINTPVTPNHTAFPGYTPLHILVRAYHGHRRDGVIGAIRQLLDAGADVTLQNTKSETVIHMEYNRWCENLGGEGAYYLVNMLLEAQKDFSKNPAILNGTSHFHIACHICNPRIAKKFLTNGEIDVNQQIDYFSGELGGCSALHLVAQSKEYLCGAQKQLETIDLLLNHGAKADVEDYYGDTPYHDCARFNSLDIFERLARSGADTNTRNINGNTPVYYYLKSNKTSPKGIKIFTRLGCRLNTYCAASNEGYLAETMNALPLGDVKHLLSVLPINFPNEMEDDSGRTVIHNIVSMKSLNVSANRYVELIEQVSRRGCDIDDRDNLGRTALHLAVKFYNIQAISGLLLAGADINILDNNGEPAIAYNFDTYYKSQNKEYDEMSEHTKMLIMLLDNNEEAAKALGFGPKTQPENKDSDKIIKHTEMLRVLIAHIKKLVMCGLDIHKKNEDIASKVFDQFHDESESSDALFERLEIVKSAQLGSHGLTLRDFLSEYGAIVEYPNMSPSQHRDIKKFFSADGARKLRDNFDDFAGILQLQYRKARARPKLVQSAKKALQIHAECELPDVCSIPILMRLTNTELMIMNTSVGLN